MATMVAIPRFTVVGPVTRSSTGSHNGVDDAVRVALTCIVTLRAGVRRITAARTLRNQIAQVVPGCGDDTVDGPSRSGRL